MKGISASRGTCPGPFIQPLLELWSLEKPQDPQGPGGWGTCRVGEALREAPWCCGVGLCQRS